MKKLFVSLILFLAFIFISVALSIIWWNVSTKPVSADNKTVRFIVTKGKTGTEVAEELYKDGLIKSPLAFKAYIRLKGKTNAIQAGEFNLSPNLSMYEIIDKFGKGPLQLWVTIPEGLRKEEIAEKYIKGLDMTSEKSETFRKEFLEASKSLEGRLFPDTYLFPRDVNGQIVVKRMNELFVKKTSSLKRNSRTTSLTDLQIITLASIIERETKGKDEKPIVAGIVLNRLDIGMPLQVDAAVQYALATVNCSRITDHCNNWWPVLGLDDLKIDSPYNTYKIAGLPPSPISNPGLSSIEAAYNPSQTDYIFYIHSSDGMIHYAVTLAEHNENVRKYLK